MKKYLNINKILCYIFLSAREHKEAKIEHDKLIQLMKANKIKFANDLAVSYLNSMILSKHQKEILAGLIKIKADWKTILLYIRECLCTIEEKTNSICQKLIIDNERLIIENKKLEAKCKQNK